MRGWPHARNARIFLLLLSSNALPADDLNPNHLEDRDFLYRDSACSFAHHRLKTRNAQLDPAGRSLFERQNLTMWMQMRRFTRLTNAFSKKVENHAHSVALHYMHYNFCRIHKTLRVTPAMAAGVTDRLWSISDMVQVLEDWEAAQ
jgi:hypothetical protein